MPTVKGYNQFTGRHWETGTIHNILAHQGVKSPHTGQPVSESLLMGIGGGAAFGYFTFEYTGYDPHVALLTRNTFDAMETIFERLALPRDVVQTGKAETGLKNLMDVLESGYPALVWVDGFSLSYRLLPYDPKNWMQVPIVVFGIEDDAVLVADRSSQPLTISVEELQAARGRIKEVKFRVVTLGAPDMARLPASVQKGLWQCISLYTDAPPKGKRENFGFAGMRHLADMLTNTRNRLSWERYFPAGSRMYAALAGSVTQPGMFDWIMTWGGAHGAERGLYADFLDEASVVLNKPALTSAGTIFREAAVAWRSFAEALLPEHVTLLKETRDLKLRKNRLFIERGGTALDEIRDINQQLQALREQAASDFPLNTAEAADLRQDLRKQLLMIHDMEYQAVEIMQTALHV